MKNKRGQVVTSLVNGTSNLVITVIVALLIVSTLVGAGLLTANSAEDNATDRLVGNFTAGIDNISGKIPTILLVGAIVILLGVIVLLVANARRTTQGGGSL